jgi:hypothetical protein
MGFVATLLIMVGAVLLYDRVQQISMEVAVGCMAVALLSLVIAIVLAPWPIQLLLLVGVLLSPSLVEADYF